MDSHCLPHFLKVTSVIVCFSHFHGNSQLLQAIVKLLQSSLKDLHAHVDGALTSTQ